MNKCHQLLGPSVFLLNLIFLRIVVYNQLQFPFLNNIEKFTDVSSLVNNLDNLGGDGTGFSSSWIYVPSIAYYLFFYSNYFPKDDSL
jgi:hypothetical protein